MIMQKTVFSLASLLFFCVNYAMNEKSLWVKTTDKKKLLVHPDIIASSHLLTILHEKHNGSYEHPLVIPQAVSLTRKDLHFYSYCDNVSSKTLYKTFGDSYYQLINTAEKLKALKKYINLIREVLPTENDEIENHSIFSSYITKKWIHSLIPLGIIKEKYTDQTFDLKKPYNRKTSATLNISNNGAYLIHDFCASSQSSHIELYNTEENRPEYQCPAINQQRTYFSPNNKYMVIVNPFQKIYLYSITKQKEHLLCTSENLECTIVISDNGQYILRQAFAPFKDYETSYALWHIDEDNNPHHVDLGNSVSHSTSVIFHPNNEHLLHIHHGNIYLYDIITGTDRNLTARKEKNSSMYGDLILSADKNQVICKTKNQRNTSLSDQINYVILNIENLKNVTLSLTPLCYSKDLPPVCIPYKNLIAYCSENKTLLGLLNKKAKLIASYKKQSHYLSTLATSDTGDYLASGYSNGTIIIWNLSTPQKSITGKKIIGSDLPIHKLRFTDHQLLFSQSKLELSLPQKKSGQALLWDINGNAIMNFGDTIFDAEITKSGNTIIVINNTIHQRPRPSNLTLTCYKTVPFTPLTLTQAYNLYEKSTKKQLYPDS